MWNMKHLIISILFAVCAVACAISFLFPNDVNFIPSGFVFSGPQQGNFAPVGAVIFTFFSVIFFKNARK